MEGYGLGVFRGLKGTLVDCWIGGWKYGVRLKDWGNAGYPANAWTLTGCSILWCDTGLSIETGWANVQGGTIEGNNVGVRCLDGHLVLNAVHLENKAANLVAQDGGSIVARDCRITVAGVGVWVREGGRFVGHGGHYAGGQLRNETTDPTRLRLVDPTFSKNSSIVGPHVIEGTARWE
jgi:hypothetical protein